MMKKLIVPVVLTSALIPTSQAALTWHWLSVPTDTAIANTISNSMNQAVASYNTYSDYTGDIAVRYNSGVPTAQTDGYMGWIEFGGSRNYRVAVHEMSHWLGTGTRGEWSGFVAGKWSGIHVNAAIRAFDGPGDREGCDSLHYWPYGWNYDDEAVHVERLVTLVGAFRRDMGLSDMTVGIAPGTYRLRNRSTIKMLDNGGAIADGAQVRQFDSGTGTRQQWTVTLLPDGYFSLQCVASGKCLDSLGNTTNGSAIGQAAANGGTSQQWQIVRTDAGFYKIINRANGKCLDAGGQTADGTGMQNWTIDTGPDQEWKFVNTQVMTLPEPGVVSQGQPTAASSSELGNGNWEGNDGCPDSRWTASTGSYPQWWRVDLGSVQPINKGVIDWYDVNPRAYQYQIETSTDDVNYNLAANRTRNTVQGTTTDLFSANARYVRVTVTGVSPSGGYAAFYDCRVYNDTSPLKLLSQFRNATASTYQAGNLPASANDGDNLFTRWAASDGSYPQWWQADLGSIQPVNKAVINWFNGASRAYRYRLETSLDGSSYSTVVNKTGNVVTGTSTDTFSALARYMRITVTGVDPSGGWAGFYEVNLYGVTNSPVLSVHDNGDSSVTVSWPASFLGSRLVSQTNLLATNWTTLAGSTNMTQITLPKAAVNDGVFFRLVYP